MSIHKDCIFKTKNIEGTGDFLLFHKEKEVGVLLREASGGFYEMYINGNLIGKKSILPSCLFFLEKWYENNKSKLDF